MMVEAGHHLNLAHKVLDTKHDQDCIGKVFRKFSVNQGSIYATRLRRPSPSPSVAQRQQAFDGFRDQPKAG